MSFNGDYMFNKPWLLLIKEWCLGLEFQATVGECQVSLYYDYCMCIVHIEIYSNENDKYTNR